MLTGSPPAEYRGHCLRCDREHRLTNDVPLALQALESLFARFGSNPEFAQMRTSSEFLRGKMIGVLVAGAPDGTRFTLRAFSGEANEEYGSLGWASPVLRREDTGELEEETLGRIAELDTLIAGCEVERKQERLNEARATKAGRERVEAARQELLDERERLRALKAERRGASVVLSSAMFDAARVANARGEVHPLRDIFAGDGIAGGTGHCAAPKLLHAANLAGLRPIGLAEAWWGPTIGGRCHGDVQPPCDRKCRPILGHLLCGLDEPTDNRARPGRREHVAAIGG